MIFDYMGWVRIVIGLAVHIFFNIIPQPPFFSSDIMYVCVEVLRVLFDELEKIYYLRENVNKRVENLPLMPFSENQFLKIYSPGCE